MTKNPSPYDLQRHMPIANARSLTSIIVSVSSQHQVSRVSAHPTLSSVFSSRLPLAMSLWYPL